MKNLTQLFALLLVTSFVISCGSGTTDNTSLMATTAAHVDNNRNAKVSHQTMDRFSAADLKLDLAAMETLTMNKMNMEDEDAAAVMAINQAFMSAEKEAQLLDVNFSMSDEPVENGMFIFSIESPDAKNLTLEMFDEEGYAMAANNNFDINEGNNYKALNVNTMENGAYVFRLKDEAGKELVRTVSINNEQ